MALWAFPNSPWAKVNGNVRVNSQRSVSIPLLREMSKPEGYNTNTLSDLSCPCLSPDLALALPLERGVPADPHGGSSYICSAEAHPRSTNKQGHMFIPHSIPSTINIYFQ